MLVSNMQTSRGNPAANQFIINTPEATYFQSYSSIIIKTTFEDGVRVVYLDATYWDYSRTTSKYRNMFLGEDTKTIRRKVASGEYRLADLQHELDKVA